jgi:hypothetical protein
MIPFVRLGGDQEMVTLLEFMVFKIIFPGGSLGAKINYIITLRIQALSLVESHDLLETDARNYTQRFFFLLYKTNR